MAAGHWDGELWPQNVGWMHPCVTSCMCPWAGNISFMLLWPSSLLSFLTSMLLQMWSCYWLATSVTGRQGGRWRVREGRSSLGVMGGRASLSWKPLPRPITALMRSKVTLWCHLIVRYCTILGWAWASAWLKAIHVTTDTRIIYLEVSYQACCEHTQLESSSLPAFPSTPTV